MLDSVIKRLLTAKMVILTFVFSLALLPSPVFASSQNFSFSFSLPAFLATIFFSRPISQSFNPQTLPAPSSRSKPTPTPTSLPTSTPTPKPTPNQTAISIPNNLINQVNAYRKSQGLSTVQTDSSTCNFAKTSAGIDC